MKDEFLCRECGRFMSLKYKGKAIDREGNSINVCVLCCAEEQKRQFYTEM